jgi:hypothetical protein
VFAQIARIKNSPGYNDYIGNELGIIAIPDTTDHPWPEFSLSFEQGPEVHRVSISFTKYGHDGVWIESRINNGEWLALGADNSKPHYDTRPLIDPALPEVREYRLRWWDKGEPNGEFSPIQKIVVGGRCSRPEQANEPPLTWGGMFVFCIGMALFGDGC